MTILSFFSGILLFFLLLLSSCNSCVKQPGHDESELTLYGEVIQEFPVTGPTETAWKVIWYTPRAYGGLGNLVITGAFFRRSPDEPWIRVLWQAEVSDIFVPYHSGFPRFLT